MKKKLIIIFLFYIFSTANAAEYGREVKPIEILTTDFLRPLTEPHDKGAHYSILVGYQGENFYVLNTNNNVFLAPRKDLLHAMDWSDTWYKKCVSNYRWVCEGTYGRYIAIR